jgi:hypothetical protein
VWRLAQIIVVILLIVLVAALVAFITTLWLNGVIP